MKRKAVIICGFPGIGKTSLINNNDFSYLKIKDLDSSHFNKEHFPNNYVDEIEKKAKNYDIVLVSTHESVRQELFLRRIHYYVVYPQLDRKLEYKVRYMNRGSSDYSINFIMDKWSNMIGSCAFDWAHSKNLISLGEEEYLSDVLENILKKDNK